MQFKYMTIVTFALAAAAAPTLKRDFTYDNGQDVSDPANKNFRYNGGAEQSGAGAGAAAPAASGAAAPAASGAAGAGDFTYNGGKDISDPANHNFRYQRDQELEKRDFTYDNGQDVSDPANKNFRYNGGAEQSGAGAGAAAPAASGAAGAAGAAGAGGAGTFSYNGGKDVSDPAKKDFTYQ